MKITNMDRTTVKLLSNAINAALQPLAAQYGVEIKRGGASFTDQNFSLKLSVAVIGEGGLTISKEATDFKYYAQFHGMQADDLGKTVVIYGKSYTITGYLPRSTKNPILVKNSQGKSYKMPIPPVYDALNKVRGPVAKPIREVSNLLRPQMPSIDELENFRAELAFEAKVS